MRDRRRPQTGGKGGAEPRATIRHREQVAVEMSAAGHTQYDIAERLGISQPAVSKILRRIDTHWIAEHQEAVGRQHARLMRQAEALFHRAVTAFDQSRGERVRRMQRKIHDASGTDTIVTELTAETSAGDPRHLEVARKALADRLRALQTAEGRLTDLPTEFTLQLDRPDPPTPGGDEVDGGRGDESDA